ncbi:MAG TPA: hypothetical protein PLS12_03095 [Bacteroidales bacterium]|nr:hypothetical protein [Bacteroidales bacterium]
MEKGIENKKSGIIRFLKKQYGIAKVPTVTDTVSIMLLTIGFIGYCKPIAIKNIVKQNCFK